MSAWIVDRAHIDVLVQALAESERVTDVSPDEIGRTLWRENLLSVACRYPNDRDGERPGPIDFRDADVLTYTYRRPARKIELGGVLSAIQCYSYQSCEHRGFETSRANAWLTALADDLKARGVTPDDTWGHREADVHGVAA